MAEPVSERQFLDALIFVEGQIDPDNKYDDISVDIEWPNGNRERKDLFEIFGSFSQISDYFRGLFEVKPDVEADYIYRGIPSFEASGVEKLFLETVEPKGSFIVAIFDMVIYLAPKDQEAKLRVIFSWEKSERGDDIQRFKESADL